MDKGEVFVTPADPVERLEQLMIEHGWGQVPVVEQGQVAGEFLLYPVTLAELAAQHQVVQEKLSGLLGDHPSAEHWQQQLEQAKLASSLESRQKGAQFEIIDRANYPLEPSPPGKPANSAATVETRARYVF